MKILIVNATDINGGAGRAAYRLHKALLSEDIESQMLVQKKSSNDFTILAPKSKLERVIALLKPTLDLLPLYFYKNRIKTFFSPSWIGSSRLINKINKIQADIVHIHWINGGMLKVEDLVKINAPIVWSMHDDFAYTGGCHIKWKCEKYKEKCGTCKVLNSNTEYDLSRWIWYRKNRVYKKLERLTIIGLSRWIMQCSENSSLLKEKRHVHLPNMIDSNIFKEFDTELSRELWRLPLNKKLILFGANSTISDINKGYNQLSEALKLLNINDIEFVVFGSSNPEIEENYKFKTHYVGHLSDDISLITLYSAVDVMLVPSLQENLSNVIMESLSCSTPVVAFDTGGNKDLIEHKITGYKAKPFESSDLAKGIEWVLNLEKEEYTLLCQNARNKILSEFDSKVVAKKYIQLYEEIIYAK
jgi:glycosyltransferase involved in cell wall biosynthesis